MELEWVFTYVVHSVVEHCIGLNSLSEETITDTSVMLYNVFVRCVWAFLVNKCITVLCRVKCLALMLLNSLAIQIVCRLTWAIVVFTSRKKDCRQLCKSLACLVEDVFAHLSVVDMLETDSDTLHLHAWSHSLDLAKCSIILSTQNSPRREVVHRCQSGLGHINKHNSESSTLRTTSRVLIRKLVLHSLVHHPFSP